MLPCGDQAGFSFDYRSVGFRIDFTASTCFSPSVYVSARGAVYVPELAIAEARKQVLYAWLRPALGAPERHDARPRRERLLHGR